MITTNEVIESYKLFLEIKYPTHFQNYSKRLNANPEAGKAEAVMFSLLRNTIDQIKIAEGVSSGGADFLCIKDQNRFMVEVTCLESESVATQSGWPNEIIDGDVRYFSQITHKLRTKISSKASQLSGHAIPGVLAITCEHVAADVLLGPRGAKSLLISNTKIAVPIGKPIVTVNTVTDLEDSIFFRFKNGIIEPCKQSISAVLLVTILSDKSSIVGILHPEPAKQFPITLLPSVPFLRLKEWPPKETGLETEWVIYNPRPENIFHQKIILNDEELKTTQ